jgi:tetratricopeptide (TPR) repeat protein
MDTESVLVWVDSVVFSKTGKRLSDLQRTILRQVWQGQKYLEIADYYGCTEGHVKDVSADLWKVLSRHLGERITKTNLRAALKRSLRSLAPAPDTHFIGRHSALSDLTRLMQQGAKIIVIQGEGGLGKTTLAQQFLSQNFEVVLELLMAKETQHITCAERVAEEWLKQDFGQDPGVEFGVTLSRLKRHLHDRKVGILIDNLEPALDQQGQLIPPHHSYVELLRVLERSSGVTLITSRDRLCEPSLNLTHYRLPGLDPSAWQQFFSSRQIAAESVTLAKIHRAYGGNAKAMRILCGAIQEDYGGNLDRYWQHNQGDLLGSADLKNLVASQVARLERLDPQAYRLFCRLGCYRYQAIATVPQAGLQALLWDVPPAQHREVIASLRHRSLVEYEQGEYWLHPVVRAMAIARLRQSQDWEQANQAAALYWSETTQTIATLEDGLRSLEAYYHQTAIGDYEAAGKVILQSRNNQWQQHLPLGSILYRMGLIQPVLDAITQVLQQVPSNPNLSELFNILGDVRWITGNVQDAIACQEKTISLATQALPHATTPHQHYYLQMLVVDALLSIGLYKIDLWELEDAAQLFQQVIERAQQTAHHRWAEKALIGLSLVQSELGFQPPADRICQSIEPSGRFAYFMQLLGQTYINLGQFEQAQHMFEQALTFAETGHYRQIQAKTLIGLAKIQRQQGAIDSAIAHHAAAIELLDAIGAKCDLAEAHFQLGLTLQKKDKTASCYEAAIAIRLFAEIRAPKQVQKVVQALDVRLASK